LFPLSKALSGCLYFRQLPQSTELIKSRLWVTLLNLHRYAYYDD
jgi:hypothetical protein